MSENVTTHLLFGFGNTCLPQLPPAWFTVERPGMFVVAVSPDNKLYFVGRDELFPVVDNKADIKHSLTISLLSPP